MSHLYTVPREIFTERLHGQAIRPGDTDDLMELYSDPEVMKTLSPDGKPWGRERVAEAVEHYSRQWEERGFGLYTFREQDGNIVGRGGPHLQEIEGFERVEVAWAVVSSKWGRGFATEIGGASLKVIQESINVSEVISLTLPHHMASRRVMEKLGFEFADIVCHAQLPHVLYTRSVRV